MKSVLPLRRKESFKAKIKQCWTVCGTIVLPTNLCFLLLQCDEALVLGLDHGLQVLLSLQELQNIRDRVLEEKEKLTCLCFSEDETSGQYTLV